MAEVNKTIEFARDVMVSIAKDNNEVVSTDYVEMLFNQIRFYPFKTLTLRNYRIGAQAASVIYRKLQFSDLTTLDLFNNEIHDYGLSPVLKVNARRINLGYNQISDQGCMFIAQHIYNVQYLNNNILECLELGIGNDYVFGRGKVISNVSSNSITAKGLVPLFKALTANSTLKYLGLGGIAIGNIEGSRALSSLLSTNQTLIGLDLQNTQIDDNGASDLIRGLALNKSLRYLNLANNQISFLSMPLLAYVLLDDCRLTDLVLANNPLTVQGAKALAFGFRGSARLQSLDLSGCGLDDQGVELLLQVLSREMTTEDERSLLESADQSINESQNGLFNLIDTIQRTNQRSVAPRQLVLKDTEGRVVVERLIRPGTGKYKKLNGDLLPGRAPRRPQTTRTGAREKYQVRAQAENQAPEEETMTMTEANIKSFNDVYNNQMRSMRCSTQAHNSIFMQTQTMTTENHRSSSLLSINVANNGAGGAAVARLCNFLVSPLCQLQTINLSSNTMNNDSCFRLASALSMGIIKPEQFAFLCNNLEVPTNWTPFEPPFVFKEVFKLPGYRETQRSRPQSRPQSGRVSAKRVRAGENKNNLTLEQMKEIGMRVYNECNDTLVEPDVSSFSMVNRIYDRTVEGCSPDGAQNTYKLAERFSFSQVYNLQLNDCHITDVGFAALSLVVCRLPNLTNLGLRNNFISQKANNFLIALSLSDSLTSFCLDGNYVSQSVLLKIRDKCEANKNKVTMNAPLKMKEKITSVKSTIECLPMKVHEEEFYRGSNNYLGSLVHYINQQHDEAVDYFNRQMAMVEDRIQTTQDAIKTNRRQIDAFAEQNSRLEQQISEDKARFYTALAEETALLEQMAQQILDKEQEVCQIQVDTIKQQESNVLQAKQIGEELVRMYQSQREYEYMVRDSAGLFKIPLKIKRAIASAFCQKLQLFGDYNELLSVVERNVQIRQGQLRQILVRGYDISEFKLDKKKGKAKKRNVSGRK